MPSLIVTSGALTGQIFSFSDAAVIGRGQFSDVRLNDPTVSRRHALIRIVGQDYELTDQDSANGTRWRGRRIKEPVLVHDGDELEFGEIKTLFRISTNQHPSLQSMQLDSIPAAADSARQPSPDPKPLAIASAAKVIASAPAPGLRELLARLKLFCDIGALARREESLREQLGHALAAILVAFPQARHAAVYTSVAASEHLSPIAQRSRTR